MGWKQLDCMHDLNDDLGGDVHGFFTDPEYPR